MSASRRGEILSMMLQLVDGHGAVRAARANSYALADRAYCLARLTHLVDCYAAQPSVSAEEVQAWRAFLQYVSLDLRQEAEYPPTPGNGHERLRKALAWATGYSSGVLYESLLRHLAVGHPDEWEGAHYTPELWREEDLDDLYCLTLGRGKVQALLDLLRTAAKEEQRVQVQRLDHVLKSNLPRLIEHYAYYEEDVLGQWEETQRRMCFPAEWWWHYPLSVPRENR